MSRDPRVLVGTDVADDAGVYLLEDGTGLVMTVDFFTPIVDDPFAFGQIAAANALSDVYAMGGEPFSALNIVCFPLATLGVDVLKQTLAGGQSILDEAGVALVGGHSVRDEEFKYGLSVNGRVHPERIWQKTGARPGDALILTKPLGTGAVAQALKKGLASDAQIDTMVASMTTLNRGAKDAVFESEVHACTDITGFGLLGHARQMLAAGDIDFVFSLDDMPWLDGALQFATEGVLPGGLKRNWEDVAAVVDVDDAERPAVRLLCDPQTSGGLFIAMPADEAQGACQAMQEDGIPAVVVGGVRAGRGRLVVR